MKDLTHIVKEFHNEWAKRPPLFTMLIAETSPADDAQLAHVIACDANCLMERGIAPILGRYHPFLCEPGSNQKSRLAATRAHAMGLIDNNDINAGVAEQTALNELHRLDRSNIARYARKSKEKKTSESTTHPETEQTISHEGITPSGKEADYSFVNTQAAEDVNAESNKHANNVGQSPRRSVAASNLRPSRRKRAAFWQMPAVIAVIVFMGTGSGGAIGWHSSTYWHERAEDAKIQAALSEKTALAMGRKMAFDRYSSFIKGEEFFTKSIEEQRNIIFLHAKAALPTDMETIDALREILVGVTDSE